MEWIGPFSPVIGALVGGLLTYLGVQSTQRWIHEREKTQYVREKLERVYMLTQSLYDGHKAEIDRLALSDNTSAVDWFKSRKHPGESMNQIKMTVAMYAPRLQVALNAIDGPHQALKSALLQVDEEFQRGASTSTTRRATATTLQTQLNDLGIHLSVLKKGLVAEASKL
jgi:hypothetical protein